MNEHDNIISAAMLLANIANAVDRDDEEFLTELAERADDPYTSTLLEYCDALADAFIENATLNESAGDDDMLLAEDMENLLEIFGLRTADKKHMLNYDAASDAVSAAKEANKQDAEHLAELDADETLPKPYKDVARDYYESSKKTRIRDAFDNNRRVNDYDSIMKHGGLGDAIKLRFAKTDKERQEAANRIIDKRHLKNAAHEARATRLSADRNYLYDRFNKNGAYRTAIRNTKNAVTKDLAAAKAAYKNLRGAARREAKLRYKDLKTKNAGLWRNREMRRQMKNDLRAERDDIKKNTGVLAFKGADGRTDYAAGNLRKAHDQLTGETSAKPVAHTPNSEYYKNHTGNKSMASTMTIGSNSRNAGIIAKDLPKSSNSNTPLKEQYDFYAYSLLESNGWAPSEENKEILLTEGAIVLDGSEVLFEGSDELILAELLDLNGFEVTERNMSVLADALDNGSALIEF